MSGWVQMKRTSLLVDDKQFHMKVSQITVLIVSIKAM